MYSTLFHQIIKNGSAVLTRREYNVFLFKKKVKIVIESTFPNLFIFL